MKSLALGVLAGSLLTLALGCAVQSGENQEEIAATSEAITYNGSGWAHVLYDGSVGAPYIYNSSGGSVTSSKLTTGQYEVDFNGLHANGSPQVVAYGGNAHCKLFTIPVVSGTKTSVDVICYTAAGAFADSDFVVTFDSRSGTDSSPYGGAYLSTGGGTSPTVISSNTWNSTGGTNTVSWDATNNWYVATLPGLGFSNAAVHVTAYGANANRCKVVSWSTGSVKVRCFDATGTAVSTNGFSLSYLEHALIPGHIGGHSWVTSGFADSTYSAVTSEGTGCATPTFGTSTSGMDLTVSLTNSNPEGDVGQSFVPMVTAYGSASNDYCSIMNWSADPSGTSSVIVGCFDSNGNVVNATGTQFTTSITNGSWPTHC